MESFDRKAHSYESAAFIQNDAAAWLAEWLPTDRCGFALEIAAGTGLFTRRIFPWNGPVLATDASAAMVAQGRHLVPAAQWQIATAAHPPRVSANWIFSSSFLQWVADPEAIFREWKSRLLPDGRILASLFIAPTLPELSSVAPQVTPLPWRTDSEWIRLFENAGFKVSRAEKQTRVYRFSGCLRLLQTLHRSGAAPGRQISGAQLRRIIREYDSRFGSGNEIPSTWTFFRIEAALR